MPDVDPPILVTGGSVTLKFRADEMPEQSKGLYQTTERTLRRITISGDGVDFAADFPTGQGVQIKIFWDNSSTTTGGGGK